ncbi:hypothetical protein NX059_007469 [Plenodomus lindquistii]|nr:hypothetical protein NX059_007469 [Plenodomus lindquistii]
MPVSDDYLECNYIATLLLLPPPPPPYIQVPRQSRPSATGHLKVPMTYTAAPFYTRLAVRLQGARDSDCRAPAKRDFARLPQTSQDRLEASLGDAPFDAAQLEAWPATGAGEEDKDKTVLYLAYGSNLCNETFRGVRGIRPLSQVNVVVPSLRLTFDLAGIPYVEPCFANTAWRTQGARGNDGYHKDRWHKGLVGVVYEVTRRDYAHIIATEGAGSAYSDILVDCHVLAASDTVPTTPDSPRFKAHTLFAPLLDDEKKQSTDRVTRPDPSYAQPSPRYLKLITDGAAECALPDEYQDYLHDIRPYRITSQRQAAGKTLFLAIWLPLVMFIFALAKKVQDKKGRAPWWFARLSAWVFLAMWISYDTGFKRVFGDGERTVGEEALWNTPHIVEDAPANQDYAENQSLLEQNIQSLNRDTNASRQSAQGSKGDV